MQMFAAAGDAIDRKFRILSATAFLADFHAVAPWPVRQKCSEHFHPSPLIWATAGCLQPGCVHRSMATAPRDISPLLASAETVRFTSATVAGNAGPLRSASSKASRALVTASSEYRFSSR